MSIDKTLKEATQEAKRHKNTTPFVGTKEEYVELYEDEKQRVKTFNLTESEQIDFQWNRVLLKTETMRQLRAAAIKTREGMLLPWFRQGDACLLYAPAGMGKSFLSLAIGLAVAGSGTIKGLDWRSEVKRKVLLIDGEMPTADLKDRIETVAGGGWIDGLDLDAADHNLTFLARLSQGDDSGFIDLNKVESHQLIGKLAIKQGIKLVILDNFSTLTESMSDENDATNFKQLNGFISRLKRQGISVLLVHHANKEGFAFRGSSALSIVFDSIIGMHKVEKQADTGTICRLAFEKLRTLPSSATATREMIMTGFGYSTANMLDTDEKLKDVIEFVGVYRGSPLSFNKAASQSYLDMNRDTLAKKLVKALDNGMLTSDQVNHVFSHLPAPVLQALENRAKQELDQGDELADG